MKSIKDIFKRLLYFSIVLLVSFSIVGCANETKKTTSQEGQKTEEKSSVEKSSGIKEFSTSDKNVVVYDKKGIKIVYDGMIEDKYNYELKFKFENSMDKNYDVYLNDDKVDGKEELATLFVDLDAKKKMSESLLIDRDKLNGLGIEKPKVVEGLMTIVYDITETVDTIPIKINFNK